MDDNKLLTLPNGERIRVADHCKLVFEARRLFSNAPRRLAPSEVI